MDGVDPGRQPSTAFSSLRGHPPEKRPSITASTAPPGTTPPSTPSPKAQNSFSHGRRRRPRSPGDWKRQLLCSRLEQPHILSPNHAGATLLVKNQALFRMDGSQAPVISIPLPSILSSSPPSRRSRLSTATTRTRPHQLLHLSRSVLPRRRSCSRLQ